ncbi:protein argonaute-2 isoform X3 [Lucilia cuprina]|uniref:protein argonaute-2 isoform X2 n=1 Tax=Lucilia cuprina TaxID=7375 RepID=UPI001F054D21|nr:protein argonaute-2 isoform X2 [Lucilia cuprina]XP_046807233.1 protein argonaute-2 isoform X3 [Lucilia cuprina]
MGKKNKYKKDESAPPQQQAQNPQGGAGGSGQQKQQQKPQEGVGGQPQQQQKLQQGAGSGGKLQQQQKPQQVGGGQPQQQQKSQQESGGQSQQKPQGAWGGGQPQQGAWGGGQPQQQTAQQGAWGGQQRGTEQQRGPSQQQWRNQPGGNNQQGERDQQRRDNNQQGGGNQLQRGPNQQQGGRDQQQRGSNQQQSGRDQQQHGSHQQGGRADQQRGPNQPQGGRDQQQRGSNQQQGWRDQQQRGSPQKVGQDQKQGEGWSQQRDQGRQHGRGGRPGQVQQQQHSATLSKQMEQLTISDEIPLPLKAKSCNGIVRGTLGKPGVVEVNYLKLDLKGMPKEAYHYDVTITPDRPKKFLRPAFEQCRRAKFPNIFSAFDGMKNCYTLQRLNVPIDIKIEVPDSSNRMREMHVEIKETDNCVVDLEALRTYQNERVSDKPMRALQVLEVVLASNNHDRGIRVGRSFFRRPSDAYNLQDGYEAWTGLYQAAILGEQPLLNVDIAHKSFPCESTIIDYLKNQRIDITRDIRQNYAVFKDVSNYLKGINILYTPPKCFGASPKQYKLIEVGDPASQKKFKTDDGKEITVAYYFSSRGYNLTYPNLNCLIVGSTVRQISLPMELCSIPSGQALNRKDKDRQVQNMIRYAATSTNRRKQKIMELLRYFDHNDNPIIREFGLRIGSNFIKVPMRLLPAPYMEYLQGQTVTTFKGAWRMDDIKNVKFLITSKPPNGHKWAILYEESTNHRGITYHDLETFKSNVIKTSQNLNMNLQNTAEIKSYNYRNLESMLKQLAIEKYDLVFVVLSDRGTSYSKIKQIAELSIGILTQCIKDKTIFRTIKDRTVFSNILLKVNGKLNGTNHKIAQDKDSNLLSPIKNVMYLGADVTHPSPDQRHIPSVVGVTASHDAHGACYNCQYRLQRSTVENIEDMESIVTRHLEVYYKYQKSYPSLLIYYRDGVSDGQFPIVEREEIRAIRNACKKKGCNPKITCVIVVKRHHTRFFPTTQPQHERDFNNVQAGTVVDQHITHPNEVQFFMVSHQSIQGTARPTRYNVILDESNFDINLLQKLTYNLCHLFPRCNRAVSYPAPAYLAHLVAFRGRVYLEGTQRFDRNLNREYENRLIKPDFLNRNPMYFI